MAVNNFLPFASLPGANVMTQAAYGASAFVGAGFTAGTAKSLELNKVWRQSAAMASMLGAVIASRSGADALDDGNITVLQDNFERAIAALAVNGAGSYVVATGAVNTYLAVYDPVVPSTPVDGMILKFKATTGNTGPAVFSPNGMAGKQILGNGFLALQGGEIVANGDVMVQYNSSVGGGCWVILASSGGTQQIAPGTASRHAVQMRQIQNSSGTYSLDTGPVNSYLAAYTPAITTLVDGMTLKFKAANANTGPSIFSPDGVAGLQILGQGGVALQGGEIAANSDIWLQYNSSLGGGCWMMVASAGPGPTQVGAATRSGHAVNAGQIQNGSQQYALDTGTANTYLADYVPAVTAPVDGMILKFKAKTANTGASIFSPNGIAGLQILGQGGAALQGGEIAVNSDIWLQYNSSVGGGCWVIVASAIGPTQVGAAIRTAHAVQMGQIQNGSGIYVAGGGTANAQTVTFAPAITALTDGMAFRFKSSAANTGAATLNVNGLGGKPILGAGGSPLQGGELVVDGYTLLEYSTSLDSFLILGNTGVGSSQQVGTALRSNHAVQFNQLVGNAGTASGLKAVVNTAAATCLFTADEVILESAIGGLRYSVSNLSQTINLGNVGTNGMDTGAAPVNGYVAIYAICTAGGTTRLLGVNATAGVAPPVYAGANMPSSYVASGLIAVLPTNGSGQFKPFSQTGRSVSIPGTQVFSGSTGGLSMQSISLAAAVPFNATNISGGLTNSSTAGSNIGLTVSSNAQSMGTQNISGTVTAGGAINGSFAIDVAVAQTAYVSTTNTAGTPTFTISVTRYSI